MMYKGGKVVKAKSHAEHLALKKKGYGHTKPSKAALTVKKKKKKSY